MYQTIACRICGKPYVFYAFYAGDQSACPSCRAAAQAEVKTVVSPAIPALKPESPVDRLIRECSGIPPKDGDL